MAIFLLENSLKVEIFYDCEDCDLEDNICISILEDCPPGERLFRAGETNIYMTPQQAQALGEALLAAVQHSGEKRS
jgi:hypothetical protein